MALISGVLLTLVGCEGNRHRPTETREFGVRRRSAPPAPVPPGRRRRPRRPRRRRTGHRRSHRGRGADARRGESKLRPPRKQPRPKLRGSAAPATNPRRRSEAGRRHQGQGLGGPGLVTTPIQAYFRTGERIAFEIQIPSAMKLYKAEHDNKGPKTHDEFMERDHRGKRRRTAGVARRSDLPVRTQDANCCWCDIRTAPSPNSAAAWAEFTALSG